MVGSAICAFELSGTPSLSDKSYSFVLRDEITPTANRPLWLLHSEAQWIELQIDLLSSSGCQSFDTLYRTLTGIDGTGGNPHPRLPIGNDAYVFSRYSCWPLWQVSQWICRIAHLMSQVITSMCRLCCWIVTGGSSFGLGLLYDISTPCSNAVGPNASIWIYNEDCWIMNDLHCTKHGCVTE